MKVVRKIIEIDEEKCDGCTGLSIHHPSPVSERHSDFKSYNVDNLIVQQRNNIFLVNHTKQ